MSDHTAAFGALERVARSVADLAAQYVRTTIGQAAAAGTKTSPTDVVTQTDLGSEALIRRELLARSPGSAIVGEEYDDEHGSSNVGWIVDPLDGTVNYLYDLSVSAVSIAATLDGKVVAGAVADIHRGETYFAAAGLGAKRDGVEIAVADTDHLGQALIGTGFSYDSEVRAIEAAVLTAVLPACRDIRCMGSAALNLCWVGCGRLDGFFERDLKIYDYAAGALIAAEAGAFVEQPGENNTDLMLAVAPAIGDQLRSLVARV